MPRAKVRHGLVPYTRTDPATGREYEDRAFRGMTIEIESQKEYDRLLALGAVVRPDDELASPGSLTALPDTASDEEILNWALSATSSELEAAARERPMLAARLRAAGDYAKERAEEYNKHLGGIVDAAERGAASAERTDRAAAAVAPPSGSPSLVTEPGAGLTGGQTGAPAGDTNLAPGRPPAETQPLTPGIQGPEDTGDEDPGHGDGAETPGAGTVPGSEGTGDARETERFDAIVRGNAKSVMDHVADNPADATGVLEAENRLAAIENRQPRTSVIRAVEVAASHAG